MKWFAGMLFLGCELLLAAAGAAAQPRQAALSGRVVAEDGRPVAAAEVVVLPAGRRAQTDAEGRFSFASIAAGRQRVQVSRMGYAPASIGVAVPLADGEELRVTLVATALAMDALQVTASPGGRDALALTQATSQLSGRALEREMGGSLAATLGREPGLAVRSMGPGATAPVMRGLTGDRVLVLQDGQRAADLAGSADDHGVTIDPLAAQRIEVVRGPATLLYGNNAVGGVVNVISDDVPLQVPARAQWVGGAQTETAYPGVSGSFRGALPLSARWALTVRGGARGTGDMRIPRDSLLGERLENTDLRNAHGALGAGYVGEQGSAGAVLRGYDFGYGLPTPPERDPVRLRGRRYELSTRAERESIGGPFTSTRLYASAQSYRHDELDAVSGDVTQAFALGTRTANLLVRQRPAGPVAEGAWGASFLGKEYRVAGEAALTPAARSHAYGVFGFQEIALGIRGVVLQLGGRFDDYRIASKASEKFGPRVERRFRAFSHSLGVHVPLEEGVSAGVNVARSFRAPTVEELFSGAAHAGTGSVELGDATLEAERGRAVEGVLRVRTARWTAQAAVFRNTIRNFVHLAARGDSLVGGALLPVLAYTPTTATLQGAEGSAEWAAGRHVVLGLMGDVLHAAQADGTPLSYMPPARLGGSLRWERGVFSAGGDLHHEFAQRRVGAAEEQPTDAHSVVRLHAGLRLTRGAQVHSLQLRGENLTNSLHREATSRTKDFAPGPGRSVALLYRVYF